ncbi:MAG: ThuA domain-containing protein [Coprobacter sp.]|nr:ThuA domain-containing protein [Coprobacter sp.]
MRTLFLSLILCGAVLTTWAQKSIDVLYLTGHTDRYHSWQVLSEYQIALLNEAEIFTVEKVVLPDSVADIPVKFSDYDVVILNVNEVKWHPRLKKSFERYMRKGGGLVIVHEADNAFPEWKEFNKMVALGGWGNRAEQAGPFYYWTDAGYVTDYTSPGTAGKHGRRVPFVINVRDTLHPIVKGLPDKWLHVDDELYGDLRGPARNIHVLATAYSETKSGGTGKEEPVLFTVKYGKGRVFHCVFGHTKKGFDKSLRNIGYQIVFVRGTEWAATGNVTLPLPQCELSTDKPTLRSLEQITAP